MAENKMFCVPCQETAKGTGCTIKGVCGKEATTSKWQDLLLSVVRGIGTIQHSIGKEPTPEVTRFLTDALFTTITNANFNDQDILQKVDKGIVLKKQLLQKAASMNIHLPAYQEVPGVARRQTMRQRAPVNPCSATRMQISARSRNSPCSV